MEFKERFLGEYKSDKLKSEILKDMNINPRTLGSSRVHSLTCRIKANESRLESYEDTRKSNSGRPVTKNPTDEEKINRLEQKIAYLNQENEFLKKIFRWTNEQIQSPSTSF